jgi:hypothetical protein
MASYSHRFEHLRQALSLLEGKTACLSDNAENIDPTTPPPCPSPLRLACPSVPANRLASCTGTGQHRPCFLSLLLLIIYIYLPRPFPISYRGWVIFDAVPLSMYERGGQCNKSDRSVYQDNRREAE